MNPQASRARRPQFIPIPPSQKLKFIKAPKTSSTENPIQQVSNTPEIVQKGQATPKPASTPPKTEQEMLKESTHGKQATAEHPKRKRDTESDSASKRSKTEREMWEEFQQGKKTTAESSKCKRETEPEAPSKGPNPEEKFVRDFVRWPKTEAEKWRDFREGIGPKPVISQEPATPRGNRYNDSKEALLDKFPSRSSNSVGRRWTKRDPGIQLFRKLPLELRCMVNISIELNHGLIRLHDGVQVHISNPRPCIEDADLAWAKEVIESARST